MKNYVESYTKSSFCVVKNIIDLEKIQCCFEAITKLALNVAKQLGIKPGSNDQNFVLNQLVLQIYAENPAAGGFMYDVMNRHIAFMNLFSSDRLNEIVIELVDAFDVRDLAIDEHQFFISRPHDSKNLLGWHQDSGYFSEYSSQDKTLVCWFCLQDCDKDGGALYVIPESHKKGRLHHHKNEFGKHKEVHPNQKGRVYIDTHHFDESSAVQLELKAGDAAFMHLDIIHKSSGNIGSKVRYTGLARYSNIFSEGYISKYGVSIPSSIFK